MKLPNEVTPESNTNGDGYISDDYEHLEIPPAPIRDGDFSEYMWMENEEEFNSQVLRQLEEEELMEECMAAMLGDSVLNEESEVENNHSNNSRTPNDNTNSSVNGLSESVNILSLSSNGVRNNSSDNFNHSQSTPEAPRYTAQNRLQRLRNSPDSSLTPRPSQDNGYKSTLNPDAKEFVPTPRTTANSETDEVPS